MSDYWQTPPQKRETLTVRIPKDLKAHLEGVIELWRALAVIDGSDPEQVNLTYVVERLLRVGVDGVWAQVGEPAGLSGMPRNKEEWELLKASMEAQYQKGRRKTKR